MNIDISGAKIIYQNPKLGGVVLTETIVNMWIIMAVIVGVCIFLTRGMQVHARTKRQIVAEFLVTKVNDMVHGNMGPKFGYYGPLIAAIMSLSAMCSLSSMVGMYAPTSDLSVLLGWALMVFVLITYTKIRTSGIKGYFKGYTEPIVILTPFNIISEIATPVSMAFRHFGNIASGSVITALIYAALASVSSAILGVIPGAVGDLLSRIPILQVGIPAVFSIYFDIFSSCLQAFIFCMLTMMYISSAAEE
ncbi:MAG: F0F1 ATP synthase subunit A [Clostridiales bacterium]|nr:F0F1 ATP synthase subunit A [Clostridiales bacterium]